MSERDNASRLAQYGLGNFSLRPTAPGTGCLGKSADFPLPDKSLVPLKSRPSLRLFWRLFRSSASVDHQMTPALFRPLFRAYALSRPSLADWLSGIASRALRPKASDLSRVRQRVIFLREKRRLPRQGATAFTFPPVSRRKTPRSHADLGAFFTL